MNTQVVSLSCEVELFAGETLTLPEDLTNRIGVGRWLISIAPAPLAKPQQSPGMEIVQIAEPVRQHDAFLNGYAPEDEGLYDDYLVGLVLDCGDLVYGWSRF